MQILLWTNIQKEKFTLLVQKRIPLFIERPSSLSPSLSPSLSLSLSVSLSLSLCIEINYRKKL